MSRIQCMWHITGLTQACQLRRSRTAIGTTSLCAVVGLRIQASDAATNTETRRLVVDAGRTAYTIDTLRAEVVRVTVADRVVVGRDVWELAHVTECARPEIVADARSIGCGVCTAVTGDGTPVHFTRATRERTGAFTNRGRSTITRTPRNTAILADVVVAICAREREETIARRGRRVEVCGLTVIVTGVVELALGPGDIRWALTLALIRVPVTTILTVEFVAVFIFVVSILALAANKDRLETDLTRDDTQCVIRITSIHACARLRIEYHGPVACAFTVQTTAVAIRAWVWKTTVTGRITTLRHGPAITCHSPDSTRAKERNGAAC